MTKFIGNTITLPKLATAPSSPVDGDAYYNTTDNKVYARINGAWVDLGATGSGATVYYQTSAPTGGTYAVGDLWVDSDSTLGGPIGTASTSAAGAVQLSDSTSTTSSSLAATSTAVKAAKDAADAKVATISGTLPITTSGTTAITVAVNAGSTSAAGVLQLTDSANSTSTTTAATPNAVLQSMKNYQVAAYSSTTRIANLPQYMLTATTSLTSGQLVFTRFIAERNFTVSNVIWCSATTASASLTLCRFGIYTRSGTTFTLVARTASDTTIFNTANTRYTRALDTTGGYPATYDFVAGSEYFTAVLQVGTTIANINSCLAGNASANAINGTISYLSTGQTDLPTSSTPGTQNFRAYAEVS